MKVKVNTNKLSTCVEEERNIKRSIERISRQIEKSQQQINKSLSVTSVASINSALQNVVNQTEKISGNLNIMANRLEVISRIYSSTELQICNSNLSANGVDTATIFNSLSTKENEDNPWVKLMKLLGIQTGTKDGVLNVVEMLSKIAKATETDTILNVIGPSLKYGSTLWDFYAGDKSGYVGAEKLCKLAEQSGKLWTGMYNILDKITLDKSGKSTLTLGNLPDCVNIFTAGAAIIGKIYEAADMDGKTMGEKVSDWMGVVSESVDLGEAAIIMKGGTKITKTAENNLGNWCTLIKTTIDVGAQTVESVSKYMEDGKYTVAEVGQTGIEVSTKGLSTLVNGVTFGIIDIDADYAATTIKDFGKNCGNEIGANILKNPEMAEKFKNGNAFEKAYAFAYGIVTLGIK